MSHVLKDCCRCCLSSGPLQHIFKDKQLDNKSVSCSEMISVCCSFAVFPNDGFPLYICLNCLIELKRAYSFRMKCDQTYKRLKGMVVVDSTQDSKMFMEKPNPINIGCFGSMGLEQKEIKLEFDPANISPSVSCAMEDDHANIEDFDMLDEKKNIEMYPIDENLESHIGENSDMYEIKNSTGSLVIRKSKRQKTLKVKPSRTCPECGAEFKKRSEYKKHLKTQHDFKSEKYFCEICKKFYSSKMKHGCFDNQKRTLDKLKECPICKSTFQNNTNLKSHIETHSEERNYVCGECGATFKQYAGLYKHRLLHQEKKFKCDYCSKKFSLKYNLSIHLRSHTQEKPFKCPLCSKSFSTGNQRNIHLTKHEDLNSEDLDKDILKNLLQFKEGLAEKQSKHLECNYCDKTFKSKANFKDHVNIHLGIKNYFCEICQKFCTSKRRHAPLHSYKEVPCQICNKVFKTKQSLKQHERLHSDERPYVCHCGATFKQQAALYKHKLIHEEKSFVCHYCSRTFVTKYKLSIHIRIHTNERPYICDQCPRKFFTGNLLNIHKIRHGSEKTMACKLCEKTFKTLSDLRQHTKVHKKDRKYPCKVCNRSFYRSDHRARHEATVHSLQEKKVENISA